MANEEDPMTSLGAANGRPAALDHVERAYDSPYWWYDIRGFFILTLSYNSTIWQQIGFFRRNISGNHLEVAIGSGTLFSMILRWHRWRGGELGRVTGIDYAKPMLAGAMKRFAGDANIHLSLQDVANMAFKDESFVSANIANAIHSFPDVDGGLREVFRVLKPGGELRYNALLYPTHGAKILRVIAASINHWGMKKGILHSPFIEQEIQAQTRAAGFVITQATRTGHALNVVALKPLERTTTRP
jgi:ubiquinone/menaquinone biosynthesis C-methylase UbiE